MNPKESESYIHSLEKIAALKTYKCSICNRIYSTQVHAGVVCGRIPLLLPCSHTLCEECLLQMAKYKNVNCKICQYDMVLENMEKFCNVFPIDRYMFGALLNLNSEAIQRSSYSFFPEKKVKLVPFQPAGATVPTQNKKQKSRHSSEDDKKEMCSQPGCLKRADWSCIHCSELYCNKCDKKIHESIRILRKHVRYPVDIADLSTFNVSCVAHADNIAEYSCMTCDNMLCSKCVIKDHTGHEIIAIEDKNALEIESFKEILQKGKHILKCMEFSQKKVKQEILTNRQNLKPTQIESDIMRHFSNLHSRLQVLEQNILQQFYKAQAAKLESLHRLSTELETNINILHPLIATGTMITESDTKNNATPSEHLDKLVISELEKEIKGNLHLPCELVKETKKVDNIQFITDDSFTEILQNHCRIKFEEDLSFELTAITDFSDRNFNFTTSEDTSSVSNDSDSVQSQNGSIISQSSQSVEYSVVQAECKTRISLAGSVPTMFQTKKRPVPKPANDPVALTKDTIENVTVTHLTNPSLFYVQLTRKKKEIDDLSSQCQNYAQIAPIPKTPEIGNTYIVQFTSKKISKWYRGLIKDEHDTGALKMYEIFYIDYGNTALVPLSKIRQMNPLFMKEPPFAYRCRLNGIISQRNEWNDEVLKYMVQFITVNTNLKMYVVQNQKGVLDVDLIAHSESLSDALIFVGYAQAMAPIYDLTRKKKILQPENRIMSAIDNYQKNEMYQICVSHIVDPHCLFIQSLENKQILKNLETAMTSFYDKRDSRTMIFTPEKGMICAAKLNSSKNKWWRVEIIDLPGAGNVEVFALDYGNTEIISWDQLCKLKDTHKQIDAQAIKIYLHDIVPSKKYESEWCEESINFLNEYVKNKDFIMIINEPSKEQLKVTLYERTPERDICVNALLVRKEFAESTGESSLLVEYHNVLLENTDITKEQHFEQLVSNVTSDTQKRTSMICDNKFLEAVEILSIESPDCFYVTIPKWAEEKQKMLKKLREFYSELISPAKSWEVNTKCVVRSTKDDKYYRGIIMKVLEDNMYEVFLKDIIRTEILPTRNLFELDEIFATHDYAFKCRLGGMKPTGGSDKWTHTAIEFFQELVGKYSHLYITKLEPIVDKILSVNLIAMWEENNGPLEPSSIQKVILNQSLIDGGLAIPVRTIVNQPEEKNIKRYLSPPLLPKTMNSSSKVVKLSKHESESDLFVEENSLKDISAPEKPTSWLNCYRLTEKQFKAWPTYVDYDGSIYLHTTQAKGIFKNVKRMMDSHFQNSHPEPPHNWEPEQMCSVQYHLDKSFCRGTITKTTSEGKILVRLIDFGNHEEFDHDELRSEILLHNIPALALRCQLANVVPKTKDGKWPINILDMLHLTIVEKECEVIVIEDENLNSDIIQILLYVGNICINNTIMDWKWDNRNDLKITSEDDDDESVIIEEVLANSKEDIDVDIMENTVEDIAEYHEKLFNSSLEYQHVDLPKDETSFLAVVINVIDYRTIIIEGNFIRDMIKETRNEFEAMEEEISQYGSAQPVLSNPIIGMPCVAEFSDDSKWYRAEILSVGRNEIKILFIDYGNVDIVLPENVRIIKQEWLDFPVSMLKCKIWGIDKFPGIEYEEATMAMKSVALDKKVICQIQEYSPYLEVKLINPDTYELVYKQLLDKEIIQRID